MILQTLTLKNYKSYQHFELTFKTGLVGIIGKNGVGKSTLFDAILYCLYGKEEDNKSYVKSQYADEKANVELVLTFELDTHFYTIKREYRGKNLTANAELYKQEVLLAKGVAAVNEEVVKLLKMERETFKRSVFSGQKELTELSQTKGEARKKMIRKMIGIDELDTIQTEINKDIKTLKDQVTGQKNTLHTPENILQYKEVQKQNNQAITQQNNAYNQALAQQQESITQLEKTKTHLQQEKTKYDQYIVLDKKLTKYLGGIETLQTNFSGIKKRKDTIITLNQKTDGLQVEMYHYQHKKIELQNQEHEYTQGVLYNQENIKKIELQKQLDTAQKKATTLQTLLKNQALLKNQNQEINTVLVNQKTELKTQTELLATLEKEEGKIQGNIDDRQTKLDKLQEIGNLSTCPTCTQPLTEVYDQTILHLLQEITTYETKELVTITQQIQQKKETINTLQKEHDNTINQQKEIVAQVTVLLQQQEKQTELTTEIQDLQTQIAEIDIILQPLLRYASFKIDNLEKFRKVITDQETQYKEYNNDIAHIEKESKAIEVDEKDLIERIQKGNTYVDVVKQGIQNLNFTISGYEKLTQEIQNIETQRTDQVELLHTMEIANLQLEQQKKDVTNILIQQEFLQTQINEQQQECQILEELHTIVGNFKTEILERISPVISREASKLFQRITDGKYSQIEVDNDFEFFIHDNGNKYPIYRFSGGEIDLANICLRIAITKAINELSGANTSSYFLAFDEILGSQDEERRNAILVALQYLQEQFTQIYLISHIEGINEQLPNLLEINMSPQGSKARWL